MKHMLITAMLSVGFCIMGVTAGSADEQKFEINSQFGMKEVLSSQIGKRVSVRTDTGEALEGTVTMVGDQLIHIARLSGKDFYDAVIRLDRISSVVFKAR